MTLYSMVCHYNQKADYQAHYDNRLSLFLYLLIFISLFGIATIPKISHAETLEPNATNNSPLSSISQHINNQKLQQLAKHKQWQHLLFYKKGKAEVISPNFYLSDPQSILKTQFDPYKELIATINLADNKKTVCKYPARYYWLSHQLPNLNITLSNCQNLPNPKQDISLILVSSYLKNPASTFGHVLIKTDSNQDLNKNNKPQLKKRDNQVKATTSNDLLNQSYNFGASIPNNENGVVYALKGLFGFYHAGFSKADFFKQDAIYSKNEQRDMWEYVLDLNEFNTALLNYHLHEAQSARFTYYFIKQNCGYRSGQILELVSDISTTDRLGAWYAPDFIFDQLVEYRTNDKQNSLIKEMTYLPSEQTQLRQKFDLLPKHIQKVVNEFIVNEDIQTIDTLSREEQALAIDFLLTHRNYKLSQTDKDDKAHHRTIKKQLVSKRFTLPVSHEFTKLPLTFKASPALSNKTTHTAVYLNNDSIGMGLTLFAKDPLNNYTDLNKRFSAVKISTQYDFDDNKLKFDEFTFLDMQQIENYHQPLAGEPRMAWQLKTGVEADEITGNGHISYIEAGIGTGLQLTKDEKYDTLAYGLVNTHIHDKKTLEYKGMGIGIDFSGQVGLRIKDKNNSRAGELEYTLRKRDNKHSVQESKMTLRQGINKNNDIRLSLAYIDNPNLTDFSQSYDVDKGLNTKLEYHYYW